MPSAGSVGGGATVTIVGSGFDPAMVITFDGIKVTGRYDSTSFAFYIETPAHAGGTVDIVVTNPDGQSQRVAAAYTYLPADAFDMNGSWVGFTSNGTDTAVEFEIRDNTLISASCAYTAAVPFVFSTLPRVQDGGFSLIAEGGATLAGQIVSQSEVVGTLYSPACNSGLLPWRVSRRNR